MRARSILITFGFILASPILLLGLWIAYAIIHGTALKLMGYPVDIAPTELAQEIFETHGDPLRCRQLQESVPTMGPSLTEQRMLCFHELAGISKDPTICEFLMPSNYGLSCINQSFDEVLHGIPDAEKVDIDADCSIYASNPIRKDFCFFSQAHRTKDLKTCAEILNPTILAACNEKIGAWYKYPELRKSDYFGKYREY